MVKSTSEGTKTMQNRSYLNYKIVYSPIELPRDFPISYPDSNTIMTSPSTAQISFFHYHNNIELGICYKGCGLFFIDGRVVPFSAGDAVIIFQNQLHIAQSDKSEPSLWKFINIDPLNMLSDLKLADLNIIMETLKYKKVIKNLYTRDSDPEINRLVRIVFDEIDSCRKNYQPMIRSVVWSLMLELSRLNITEGNAQPEADYVNLMKITPALQFISDNYMDPINLDDLSNICHLSQPHLRRLFRTAMALSPIEYLNIVRIKMASILLVNLEEPIIEISMKVGYTTISSFNRHFRSIMGVSPKEWRKQNTS